MDSLAEFVGLLNILYRRFQDAYIENPESGIVGIVTIHRRLCNCMSNNKHLLTDLPEDWMKDELRSLEQLLPKNARIRIWCIPDFNDIIEIIWDEKV